MRHVNVLALFASVAASAPVSAQAIPRLDSATRVRVTAPARGLRDQLALVVGQRADTLWVDRLPEREITSLSTYQVTRLEVSNGRGGHALRGAGFGLLAGATLGAGLGYAFPTRKEACFFCGDRSWDAGAGALTGALIGVVAGTIVGAHYGPEQWQLLVPGPVADVGPGFPGRVRIRAEFRRAF